VIYILASLEEEVQEAVLILMLLRLPKEKKEALCVFVGVAM
jgi:hypothetical protein